MAELSAPAADAATSPDECPRCAHSVIPGCPDCRPSARAGTSDAAVPPGLRARLAGKHGSDTLCLPVGALRDLLDAYDDRGRKLERLRAQANCGQGHDPERICCAHAKDVRELRADLAEHQRLQTLGGPPPAFTDGWRRGTLPPPPSASDPAAPPHVRE